jgi:hypothetical protein
MILDDIKPQNILQLTSPMPSLQHTEAMYLSLQLIYKTCSVLCPKISSLQPHVPPWALSADNHQLRN